MPMRNRKKRRALAVAFLFSLVFTLSIRIGQGTALLNASVWIFTATNFLTVLCIVMLFHKILADNAHKSLRQLKKQMLPSFIFFLIVTVFLSLFFYSLGVYILYLIEKREMDNYLRILFQRDIPSTYIPLAIGLFFTSVVFFYTTWRQAIEREQRLQEEKLKYRYRTLKTQVNPHFLFNSLNTLSEVIYEDVKKADRYIQKLAGIYRYILDNEEIDLIPLSEEIDFVKQYFSLQKERLGNKIQLEMGCKNADKFEVIPISLQILVENALKHNIASEGNPLKIRIYIVESKYIIVSNSIQKKNIFRNFRGTGLANLKERVKLMMGEDLLIDQSDNQFLIRLPIIRICP